MTTTNTYGRQVVVPLTNKSGGSVAAGDVVIIDSSNNDAFTTTTTGAYTGGIGVAQETIASNATGRVLLSGYASLVNVQASVTRGNFAKTYTVVKQATDAGSSRIAGTFGIFLTGGTTPDAIIWQPDLGAGSGLSDPMTTRGDIIVRNSSNVTARLAIGSSGKVLQSDGTDISWQTPASSLMTPAYVSNTSDVTGMNSTSLADVTSMSTSITTGAHRVLIAFSGVLNRTGGSNGFGLSIDIDGTQVGGALAAYTVQTSYHPVSFQIMSAVLSAASHTVKLRYKADSGTTFALMGSSGTGIGNLMTVIETSLAV